MYPFEIITVYISFVLDLTASFLLLFWNPLCDLLRAFSLFLFFFSFSLYLSIHFFLGMKRKHSSFQITLKKQTRFQSGKKLIQMLSLDMVSAFYCFKTLVAMRLLCKQTQNLQIAHKGFLTQYVSVKESQLFKFKPLGICNNGIINVDCRYIRLHLLAEIEKKPPKFFFSICNYLHLNAIYHVAIHKSIENGLLKYFPNIQTLHLSELSCGITQLTKTRVLSSNKICVLENCHALVLIHSPLTSALKLENLLHFHCYLPWQQLISSLKNLKNANKLKNICFVEQTDLMDPITEDGFVLENVTNVVYISKYGKLLKQLKALFPRADITYVDKKFRKEYLQTMLKFTFEKQIPTSFLGQKINFLNLNDFWIDNF